MFWSTTGENKNNKKFPSTEYQGVCVCLWYFFLLFQGPLTVTIQELDGSFNHNFKIEENKTKFDITCHSKCRRYLPKSSKPYADSNFWTYVSQFYI